MSHHHHHSDSCCKDDSCTCCCHHHHDAECHESCDFTNQLFQLADEAWMEVLKEKIKEQIKSQGSTQLDELAKLVSQTNHARWKGKMECRKGEEEFETQLRNLMHFSCKDNSCKR